MTSKRMMDVVLSAILLIVLSPLLVIIGALIRLRMGNPVLYEQVRPGINAQPFTLIKFRTMDDTVGSDGQPLPDEDRLTPLGAFLRRWSLDELPELWNVLRGDMSLVGPRPLLVEYLDRYNAEQARRHEVKPGITGLSQVSGRNSLFWEERLALDVWYVDNRSLWLDLKVLSQTVVQVVKRRGISAPGEATMPEFKGSNK